MSNKLKLVMIVLVGLVGCVSKSPQFSEKRIIASTGKPFDEAKYKAILEDMQNTENETLNNYDESEENQIERDEVEQDKEKDIQYDVAPADEPVYTSTEEESFIKNIGAESSIPELLAAAKKTIANTGTWGFQFVYIDKDGNQKILSQYNPHSVLKPASTQKLFTGYLFFASNTFTKSYSKNHLAAMLHVSQNEMADSALKRVASQKGYESNQIQNGLSILKSNYAGLSDSNRYSPIDGSGLSYLNKVTPDLETSLLTRIYRGGRYAEFKKMLAHPGESNCSYNPRGAKISRTKRFQWPDQLGTKHPFHSTVGSRLMFLSGRLHAKTGTLKRTKALAGFVDVKGGGVIVFSVIGDYLKVGTPTAFAKINSVVAGHVKYIDSYLK